MLADDLPVEGGDGLVIGAVEMDEIAAAGPGSRIEEAAVNFQMSRSFAVNLEMKKGVGLYAFSATNETGAAILTNLSVTAQSWLYSPDWNMMRVTRRGPGIPAEWFSGDILSHFFYIKFR